MNKAYPQFKAMLADFAPLIPVEDREVCGLRFRSIQNLDFDLLQSLDNPLYELCAMQSIPRQERGPIPDLKLEDALELIWLFTRSSEAAEFELERGKAHVRQAAIDFCAAIPERDFREVWLFVQRFIAQSIEQTLSALSYPKWGEA